MARIGSQKVKTGCKTCKIRKVKCDETWPECLRCKKTGRTCDGYQAPPPGSISWDVLLRAQPSVTPASNNVERRSLAFFHQVVAPSLSGPFDSSFWTHLVAQATHHIPAARHAVLSISSFFESFSATTCQTTDNPFAIRQYNQAIKTLMMTSVHNIDTVLTVCILFICIEFLRGDKAAAISHLHHGNRLVITTGGSPRLNALFSHINIFPLFFGTDLNELPIMKPFESCSTGNFQSMIEAQHSLDILLARTVRLVRATEAWQIGESPEDARTPESIAEQHELIIANKKWGDSFARFQARRSIDPDKDAASLALKMRWLTCSVWVKNCLSRGETIYDKHLADVEAGMEMAKRALYLDMEDSKTRARKFMFEMGFSPLLHFIAIKCRNLRLRVTAIALMKALACSRESIWDALTMEAIGRRIVEIEHGIELGPRAFDTIENDFKDAEMPPEKDRIRGYLLQDVDTFKATEGVSIYRRPIKLLAFGPNGEYAEVYDWITIYT